MHGWCSYRYYCNEATYTQQAYYIMNGTVFLFHQLAMVISLAYSQLITIAIVYVQYYMICILVAMYLVSVANPYRRVPHGGAHFLDNIYL